MFNAKLVLSLGLWLYFCSDPALSARVLRSGV